MGEKKAEEHDMEGSSTKGASPEPTGPPKEPLFMANEDIDMAPPDEGKDNDVNEDKGSQEYRFQSANMFRTGSKRPHAKVDYFEGIEGFKIAGSDKQLSIKLPQRCEDFSFLKKNKVKFNCVDVQVKKYQVDPDELEEQKKHSSRYL